MKKYLWIFVVAISFGFSGVFAMNSLLEQSGQGSLLPLQKQKVYSLITWNIYKNKNEGVLEDLQNFVESHDFVLMQEFILSEDQNKLMSSTQNIQWSFAKSFEDTDGWTGVSIASAHNALQAWAIQSPDTEPVTNTPKMSMIAEYKVEGSLPLWVVTFHGLNFDVFGGSFKNQVADVVSHLKKHKGPIIFAGDFNTWSSGRLDFLLEQTASLGLERVDLEAPMGIFSATLDHIFYRGVDIQKAFVLEDITSSDHLPLRIEFTFKKM